MDYSNPSVWDEYLTLHGHNPDTPPPPPEVYKSYVGEALDENLKFWAVRQNPALDEERKDMHEHLLTSLHREGTF